MDWALTLKTILLGIVEGLTEFIPVSSSGHLIVAGHWMDFTGEQAQAFDVVVQFGAILALCCALRDRIAEIVIGCLRRRPHAWRLAVNIVLACAPAGALGLMFAKQIKAVLFTPASVALALVAGGFVILWVERRQSAIRLLPRVRTLDEITALDALKIGLAQCFALIPGVSRSGSTIIGGMLCRLERRIAVEFSFLLAIPLLFSATVYELYAARNAMGAIDLGAFASGFCAAFVSALACVRWLLNFIASHNLRLFAWYRIGFGMLIFLTAKSSAIN